MSDLQNLLEKRRAIKRKKPKFNKQDAHKMGRLSNSWRKPRGIDSKVRLNLRGYRKGVQVGYGSPKGVKGLDKNGLMVKVVYNINDLNSVNKEKDGVIISSAIGMRKKVEMLKKANDLGIKVWNIKNTEGYLKSVEIDLKTRKESRAKRFKKIEKKKEIKKEKKDDKLSDKILSEEEKVKKEKEEKDKVLTKKEL